jgi:flagellar hook-length control protein FliK
MNAPGALPLTPATSLRTRSSSGGEVRGSSGASPFASALDDALAADRPQPRSDRAPERRCTPDDRGARALERAADAQARADRAAERSAEHADRAAARTDRPTEAARRTAPVRSGGTTSPQASDATEESAEVPEETPATGAPAGLPSALWALALGGPLATAGQAEVATPVAADAVTGMQAPTGTAPDADLALPAPVPAASAAPATAGTGTSAAAVPAPATAEALAGFTVVPVEAAPAPATAPAGATTPVATAAVAAPPGAESADAATSPVVVPAPAPAATPTTGDGTAAPAPGAVPTVAAGGAGGASSSVAGNPGTGSRAPSAPAADAAPEVTPIASASAPAPAAAVTPAASTAATGDAAALPVGSQVARQVAVLGRGPDGSQTMTLVLNPENLGPVEVSVTLTKGSVDLTLRGAHEQGRAALLDGLPDLRRDLESAGLSPSRLEVDRDTGGSWLARHAAQQQAEQQAAGQRGGQPDRGDSPGGDRSRPWSAPADTAVSGPTPPRNRSTSLGVDVRV